MTKKVFFVKLLKINFEKYNFFGWNFEKYKKKIKQSFFRNFEKLIFDKESIFFWEILKNNFLTIFEKNIKHFLTILAKQI